MDLRHGIQKMKHELGNHLTVSQFNLLLLDLDQDFRLNYMEWCRELFPGLVFEIYTQAGKLQSRNSMKIQACVELVTP